MKPAKSEAIASVEQMTDEEINRDIAEFDWSDSFIEVDDRQVWYWYRCELTGKMRQGTHDLYTESLDVQISAWEKADFTPFYDRTVGGELLCMDSHESDNHLFNKESKTLSQDKSISRATSKALLKTIRAQDRDWETMHNNSPPTVRL